jgi:hypothetical protein
MKRDAELTQIIETLGASRRFASALYRRKKEGGQKGNNPDHDHQLD